MGTQFGTSPYNLYPFGNDEPEIPIPPSPWQFPPGKSYWMACEQSRVRKWIDGDIINYTLPGAVQDVICIYAAASTDVWAITATRLFHFDGFTWTEVENPIGIGKALYHINGRNANEVYLTGVYGGNDNRIAFWDGVFWSILITGYLYGPYPSMYCPPTPSTEVILCDGRYGPFLGNKPTRRKSLGVGGWYPDPAGTTGYGGQQVHGRGDNDFFVWTWGANNAVAALLKCTGGVYSISEAQGAHGYDSIYRGRQQVWCASTGEAWSCGVESGLSTSKVRYFNPGTDIWSDIKTDMQGDYSSIAGTSPTDIMFGSNPSSGLLVPYQTFDGNEWTEYTNITDGLGILYLCPSGENMFSTIPLGAFYCDDVKLLTSGGLAFYNRLPSPQIKPGIETGDEPFNISTSVAVTLKTGRRLLQVIAGSPGDSILKTAHLIRCALGGFTQAHAGKTFQVSGSTHGNDGDYTIVEVIDAERILVNELPFCDETGNFLNVLFEDGVYTRETEEGIIFEPTDFAIPSAATAEEIVTTFNTKTVYAEAATAKAGLRARFTTEFEFIEIASTDTVLTLHPSRSDRYTYEALETEPLTFDVATLGNSPISRVTLKARLAGVIVQIWDSLLGTAPSWTVECTPHASPGSGFNDVWSIVAEHEELFASEDIVEVTLWASLEDATELTESYTFCVRDYEKPTITSLIPWTRDTLRIEFSEPMLLDSSTVGAATYVRKIPTHFNFHARYNIGTELSPIWRQNVIEAIAAVFSSDEVGLFLGIAYAMHSINNGSSIITEWLSSKLICVDSALVDESYTDLGSNDSEPLLTISPYRLTPQFPELPIIQPAFTPIPASASEIDPLMLAPYADTSRFVMLTLNDSLTPIIDYKIEVRSKDSHGVAANTDYIFSSWKPYSPPNRKFSLWDFIPDKNKREDTSRDLERFVRCLDEPVQLMLADVDDFGGILDPIRTRSTVVDFLLSHLGNPFSFATSLSLQKRRDLIYTLIPAYKSKGTAKAIEDIVLFITGKTITIKPWDIPSDTWTLSVSQLGYNTYLGPSRVRIRYTFYAEHTEELTSADRKIIEEVIQLTKPAHTHFYGFVKI